MTEIVSLAAPEERPPVGGLAVAFADLPGWSEDDPLALREVFLKSCAAPAPLRVAVARPPALEAICRQAAMIPAEASAARRFFEETFQPYRIGEPGSGFMTGYFEPEFEGSLTQTPDFPTPVYDRPADLVTKMPGDDSSGFDPGLSAARRTSQGLEAFPDRAAIEAGALKGQGLEILWLRDPVDRFVMQVQGSGRIRLPDGNTLRLTYSGRNGHPYTSLGKRVSQERNIPPEEMTMDRLIALLKADAREAERLIQLNRSFVFFTIAPDRTAHPSADPSATGPIGGEGVALTPLRSIAADRTIWPYGLPVFLTGEMPAQEGRGTVPLARAAVIQDTGSAILGPARIDLFYGSGPEAGHRAGLTRHPISFHVLWPRQPRQGG